ncbi:MAG: RagB/SusD family nutrient uptake outer membrane protein [Tannerella sp.]|jgi:tetratricopeptide (TPR) repeat protein|nr:RagB/SusD family nutrient uptake outer membrane protein [Tannerella sp.]
MKKISILIVTVLLAVSCSDFLKEDPKTAMSPDKVYQSVTAYKQAVYSMYRIYRTYYTKSNDEIFLTIGSDDINSYRNEWDWGQSDKFHQSDGISRLEDAWEGAYFGLLRANFVIENGDNVPTNSVTEEALKNNCLGQGYFQRAHWLFWLAKFWGPVPMPLITTDIGAEKRSVADIYDQVISDLEQAVALLPYPENQEAEWKTTSDGKSFSLVPHKGSAKALLAQVYLQSAGWPLKRTENYAKAAQYAKEVIDEQARFNFGLVSIDRIWTGEAFFDEETIYGVPFSSINTGENYTMHVLNDQIEDEGGWSTNMADLYFFERFPEGRRKEVTFQTTVWVKATEAEIEAVRSQYGSEQAGWPQRNWNGQTYENGEYTWENYDPDTQLEKGDPFYDVRDRSWRVQVSWDSPRTLRRHPFYAKNRFDDCLSQHDWKTRSLNGDEWASGVLQRWMRYAEVLLIYAEAKAMSGSLDQSCIDALNQVRARAGEPRGLAQLGDYASAQDFQRDIFDERGWEFCGLEYGTRWSDLLRLEKVEEMNAHRLSNEVWPDTREPKEQALVNQPSKKYYYFLVPAIEKSRAGLTDNNAETNPIEP